MDIDPARLLFTFMDRKRTGLQVAASTPVSTPNGVDRIRRRADCVIMDVNSEMSASDRFFFSLVLSKPPVHFCQQNGYRKTEEKKKQILGTAYFLLKKMIFHLLTVPLKEFSKEFVSNCIF